MTPIYLHPSLASKVLKLAEDHDKKLYQELAELAERDDQERAYALRAELELADEELEIDHNPVVSVGDGGAWVLCWNYLTKEEDDV